MRRSTTSSAAPSLPVPAGWFPALLSRRPELVDAGVVLVVLTGALARYWEDPSSEHRAPVSAGSVVFDVVISLTLLRRRQRPAVVFALVACLSALQSAIFAVEPGLAVLVALFSLAAYDGRRRLLAVAFVVLEAGAAVAVLTFAESRRDAAVVALLTGTVTSAVALGVYQRTRRAYLASLVERAARLEVERDQQAQLAAAAERARIARELHDVVAHSLTVMIALTDGAAYVAGAPEPSRRAVMAASAAGRQALAEMRRLVGVLRSDDPTSTAPQPGFAQVEQLVEQTRAAGLPVDLVITGHVPELPPSAGLTIYRVIQESLTNVRKHAPDAGSVTVRIVFGDGTVDADGTVAAAGTVEVEVTDDGAGGVGGAAGARADAAARALGGSPAAAGGVTVADPGERRRSLRSGEGPGHGLLGMRERTGLFGGTVEAGRVTGGGWRVRARWQLPPHADDPATSSAREPAAEPVLATAAAATPPLEAPPCIRSRAVR